MRSPDSDHLKPPSVFPTYGSIMVQNSKNSFIIVLTWSYITWLIRVLTPISFE